MSRIARLTIRLAYVPPSFTYRQPLVYGKWLSTAPEPPVTPEGAADTKPSAGEGSEALSAGPTPDETIKKLQLEVKDLKDQVWYLICS